MPRPPAEAPRDPLSAASPRRDASHPPGRSGRAPGRRATRVVRVGDLTIGGSAPILVQSMTTTDTRDTQATLAEAGRLIDAGCEMVRVAVPDRQAAAALGAIARALPVPLVADIHFDYRLALAALDQGVAKIRTNPGNVGGLERFRKVVLAAKERDVPMRIGVNSGSVEKPLLEKYGYPSPAAIVESAMHHLTFCRELGYDDVILSLKSSRVSTCVASYRQVAELCDAPLHVGVTEAGLAGPGSIKSAVGIGALLLEGIGDTIRVSLTGDPVAEIAVAYDILQATGARVRAPEVVACPTCGRIEIELEPIVREVEQRLRERGIDRPLRISILGCAVNGPGEAREADIGIAGGRGQGIIFVGGKMARRVPESQMVPALLEEIEKLPPPP